MSLRGASIFVILILWEYADGHALSQLSIYSQPRPKLVDDCHIYPPISTTPRTTEKDPVCDEKLSLIKDNKRSFRDLKGVYEGEHACFWTCLVDCCFRIFDLVLERKRLAEFYVYNNRERVLLSGFNSEKSTHFYFYCEDKQDDPQCRQVMKMFVVDYYRSLASRGDRIINTPIPPFSGINYMYIVECDEKFEGYEEYLCKYVSYITPWIYHKEPELTVKNDLHYKQIMVANNSICSSQIPDGDFTIEKKFQLPCYVLLGSQTGVHTFLKEFDSYCKTFLNGIPNAVCKSAYATCRLEINEPDLETKVKEVSGVDWKRPIEYCKMVTAAYDVNSALVGQTKNSSDITLLDLVKPYCKTNDVTTCRVAAIHIAAIKPGNDVHFFGAACDARYAMCDYYAHLYTTQYINNAQAPYNSRCLINAAGKLLCQKLATACKKLKSSSDSCRYIVRSQQLAELEHMRTFSLNDAQRFLTEYCDGNNQDHCTKMANYIARSTTDLKVLSNLTNICNAPQPTTPPPTLSVRKERDNSCTAYLKAVIRSLYATKIYTDICNMDTLSSHMRVCNLFFEMCGGIGKDRGICNTIEEEHNFFSAVEKVSNKTLDNALPVLRAVCLANPDDKTCIRFTTWLQTERDFSLSLYEAVCVKRDGNLCFATLRTHFERFNASMEEIFNEHCFQGSKSLASNGTCTAIARYCDRETYNADCYAYHISKCRRNHVFAQEVCGPLADIYCAGKRKDLQRCDEFFKEIFIQKNERIKGLVTSTCEVALPKGITLSEKCKSFLQVDIEYNGGVLVNRMYQHLCSSKVAQEDSGNICQIISSICEQSSRTCKGIIELFDLQQVCQKEVDDGCKKALETYCIDERNEEKMEKCDKLLKDMPVQTMLDAYKFECIERGNGKVCARTQFQILTTGRILRLFDEYCRVWVLSGKCREIRTICKETEIKYQDCNTVMRPYYIIGGISLVGLAIGLVLICGGAGLFIWEFNNQSEVMEEVVEKASSTSICEASEHEDADPDDMNDMTMTLGEGEEEDWEDELEGVEGDEEPAPDPAIAQDLDDYEDEFGYTSLGGAAVQAAIEREAADAAAAAQQAAAELAAQQAAQPQPPADQQYVAIQQATAVQQPPAAQQQNP